MYLDRFGLNRPPFEETANPDFFFETDALRTICKSAGDRIAGDGGFVLIEGQSGAGKTMLAHILARRVREDARVLAQISSRDECAQVLARIAAAVNIAAPVGDDSSKHVARLIDSLEKHGDKKGVIIIDDAETLDAEDLLALQQLINTAGEHEFTIVVVLVATPAIKTRLRLPEVRDIARGMHRTPQLFHPDRSDTAAYLVTRLQAAGAKSTDLFTAAAIDSISALARGKMRQINALADAALQRAADQDRKQVDADLIDPSDIDTAPESTSTGTETTANEEPAANVTAPAEAELSRMEDIVTRFADLTEFAPQRIGALDSALDRLSSRADHVFDDATRQIERLEHLSHRFSHNETSAAEQLPQLERLTAEASQLHQRLADIVEKLADVDATSQDRISLLLSGLDSAEEIHNKLESAGQQVTGLIEESRQAAMTERDALVGIFEQLSARREELTTMMDGLRHQRQKLLEENEQAVAEMIDRCRTDATKACEVSANALTEARRTADANRVQLREHASAAASILSDGRNACKKTLDEVRALEGKLAERSAQLADQFERYDERLKFLADVDRRSSAMVTQADRATDRLGATITQAEKAANKVAKELDDAEQLREGCITTLERVQTDNLRAIEERQAESIRAIEERQADSIRTIDDRQTKSINAIEHRAEQAEIRAAQIEQRAEQAEQFLRDALARFEALVATEQTARNAADNAVKAARTALASVQQSEAKLAAAQSAAIDIEATASAALTAVQQQIKRFEDSVGVIARHGVDKARTEISAMLDNCAKTSAATSTALAEAVSAGVQRVQGEVDAATEQADALQTAIKIAVNAAEDGIKALAADMRGEFEQRIAATTERSAELEAAINAAAEQAQTRITEHSDATRDEQERISTELIERYRAELDSASESGIARFNEELVDRQCATTAAIELTGDQVRSNVLNAGEEFVGEARERILSAAAGAAQSLESEITAANNIADQLTKAVSEANKVLADARTTREQIDHQIRDVWSLTETTDQRARALGALADKAATSESHLAELVTDAARRANALIAQSDVAKKSADLLTAQQTQVKDICAVFTARIAEARKVCAEVIAANETGKNLHPQLSHLGAELRDQLDTASDIVESIRNEADTARVMSATVEQVGTLVAALDSKVTELQESLANPIGIIQDARGQADELNEICLAVKRVFRSVSQASLQANDRIKMLSKLLVATERSARTMQQWVQQASTTQARLADTIARSPSINDTHPLVGIPGVQDIFASADDRGVRVAAPKPMTTQSLSPVPDRAAVANASIGGKPIAASAVTDTAVVEQSPVIENATSAEKTVTPLMTVLKAKQAQRGKTPTPRLTPADVQDMINAAHKKDANR
ncbi:MAG: AAA family ATPase [Phycisphaerales bacterium]|nr:AAA family ATPase [Phycisphaerales bacterium]